jgi:hypothetical protein
MTVPLSEDEDWSFDFEGNCCSFEWSVMAITSKVINKASITFFILTSAPGGIV